MASKRTKVGISSPPERVRQIFLDWPNLLSYHRDGFFQFIEAVQPLADARREIQPGVKVKVKVHGMAFTGTSLENTPAQLVWRGALPLGTFHGDQYFGFTPSKITPGGTTFQHGEDFGGLLGFALGQMLGGEKQARGFGSFNGHLKARAERRDQAAHRG